VIVNEVIVLLEKGIAAPAFLEIPENVAGAVLFAHGSGSSRHSPRNRFVAEELGKGRLATLLVDLLTPDEDAIDRRTGEFRFDIPLLARRLTGATMWARKHEPLAGLPFGYFGASTGAAAALIAAATLPGEIGAVVSRGGRPDLAGGYLREVRTPTLFIVGSADEIVLKLNRDASAQLSVPHRLVVVPGATHLFEEPGALTQVARHARAWFSRYLTQLSP
jgi:putative phosphoribosyl transferase